MATLIFSIQATLTGAKMSSYPAKCLMLVCININVNIADSICQCPNCHRKVEKCKKNELALYNMDFD